MATLGNVVQTFCKAIESHGTLWKERRRKATEGHGMSRNTLEIPWNVVGTNDREVECHGRPWNVMEDHGIVM